MMTSESKSKWARSKEKYESDGEEGRRGGEGRRGEEGGGRAFNKATSIVGKLTQ